MPTMPATFSVPARRLRSCLPPVIGGCSRTPRRIQSAPDALRSVELVRRERQQIDAERLDVDRDLAGRLHGVGVEQRAARLGDARQLARRAGSVPISLLACITDTSAVSSVRAARSASGDDDAALVDRQQRRLPAAPGQRLQRVEDGLVLDGAGDQVLPAGRPRAASATPRMAKLSLSVPPLVKTTSDGSPPISAATARCGPRRAAALARCPKWWTLDGLPNSLPQRGRHALDDRGGRGRRGVVVEVDPHVRSP